MACGVCARSTRRDASLPGEGSTHLRGCGMTAVATSDRPTIKMALLTHRTFSPSARLLLAGSLIFRSFNMGE